MRKKSTSQSGLFDPPVLAAFAFGLAGLSLAFLSLASTPSSGSLSEATPVLTYDAGPFTVPNRSPLGAGLTDTGPRCDDQFPCDNYELTVTLPAGYVAAHPNSTVKVTMFWSDLGSGNSDYDLYIYKGVVGNTTGSQPADQQSNGQANPEIAAISPLVDGDQKYSIKIVPFTPTQEIVHVRIELLPGSAGGGSGPFGGADPTTPGIPRYQIFVPPPGSSAESSQGEFNIGLNPQTGRILMMNIGPIWRLTPPELQSPSKPECCEGLWENKSAVTTNTGLDPILWTDQKTGRSFASNSYYGANAVYAYSDDDGDSWTEFGISPPNGGADHQSIGSGPYPASLSALSNSVNQGEAVYYCSQSYPLGPATCQRSDSLGASYGPGVLAYEGNGVTQCESLHGHVHVAPDGTVWLPVKQCGGAQGGALSTDGGATWNEFIVTGSHSQANGADPSVAIDADSTVYYAYVNNEPVAPGDPLQGHARVAVGHRNATTGVITWSNDFDLGASHGIVNAAHIEAVGGSSGRAAVGFLGTDVVGDYQISSFTGKWYAFIATTYDGGVTWTTVNATPNDPVQSMTGIWQQGGSHDDRNLLDFNEITLDGKGRVLYGYSDGCVSEGCIAGTLRSDFTGNMRVARQSGGKSILAAFDPSPAEPLAPKSPCLSGTRDSTASYLKWVAPDNSGADITGYQILRGTTAGTETVIVANTGNTKTIYNDLTTDPAVQNYFYVVNALNAQGTGSQSNEISLAVTVLPTQPPSDWATVSSSNTNIGRNNQFLSVTCVSSSDCWAVGYYVNSNAWQQSLVEHWDGTSWAIVGSPNTSAVSNNPLNSVACTSANDCWAVGLSGGNTGRQTLIERWDGVSWSIISSPNPTAATYSLLNGVTCSSANDCWAVGQNYIAGYYQTLIERWDGTAWNIVPSDNSLPVTNNVLQSVTCVSGSDCWAVGTASNGSTVQTLTEHWDGTSWSVVNSPNTSATQENDLYSVACASASDCQAVGYFISANAHRQTLIEHWDGTSWAIVPSPNTSAAQSNYLYGVTCVSATNCSAVGYGYTDSSPNYPKTLIERWDGTSWAIVSSPNPSIARTNELVAVTCPSASDCWAVGSYLASPSVFQTLTQHYPAIVPPIPTTVVSRKTHGIAGDFDVDLPLSGTPGIECRSGGANGDYQVVVTFAVPVTLTSASAIPGNGGTASVSGNAAVNGNQVTVNLTNVSNAQILTVNLLGVSDGTSTADVAVPMAVLIGDTTGNGTVNSSDIAQTQSQSGQSVTASNFREDVTANGAINSSDIALVQSKSGTGLSTQEAPSPTPGSEPLASGIKKTRPRRSSTSAQNF